jgi:hypothetical protein
VTATVVRCAGSDRPGAWNRRTGEATHGLSHCTDAQASRRPTTHSARASAHPTRDGAARRIGSPKAAAATLRHREDDEKSYTYGLAVASDALCVSNEMGSGREHRATERSISAWQVARTRERLPIAYTPSNAGGHVSAAPAVTECADDAEAVAKAKLLDFGPRCVEIWQGSRQVAVLPTTP